MPQRKDETDLDFANRRIAELQRNVEEKHNEVKRARRSEAAAIKASDKSNELLDRLGNLHKAELRVPKWASKSPRKQETHVARPVLMLSDLHLDEVVDLDTMDGLNAYDRSIAEARLERTVEKTVDYLRRYTAGVSFDGITVMLGGDIVTGTIHEELANTNESPLPDTIQHWIPILASAIEHLADEFGRVHVPCVDGNHDRSGRKPTHKRRALDSWAWTMYCMLAYIFRDDDRVDITVSESSELIVPAFDTNFLLVHGDGATGGNGIGGVAVPISRYVYKKQSVYASTGRPFDYAIMGHWHQLISYQSFFVNGSLKGYDEYAKNRAFGFERPQQLLLLVTPERGVTLTTGIHAE